MRPIVARSALSLLLLACGALAGCHSPAADGASPVNSPTPSPAASATSAPVTPTTPPPATSSAPPVKPTISKAALDYFFSIALGNEYGDKRTVVAMWTKQIVTVRVHGGSARSRSCLNKVISDFNALTATTDLRLTPNTPDIELHFAPVSTFRSLDPDYVKGNDGYFTAHWTGDFTITDGLALIRTTGITENIRCHLIREELTQVMGLMRDSGKYRDSIFYSKYLPSPTRYSALDQEIIRFLYGGVIVPGDSRTTILAKVTIKK